MDEKNVLSSFIPCLGNGERNTVATVHRRKCEGHSVYLFNDRKKDSKVPGRNNGLSPLPTALKPLQHGVVHTRFTGELSVEFHRHFRSAFLLGRSFGGADDSAAHTRRHPP